jgi:imidazolonepropionase-like amidohydrolase
VMETSKTNFVKQYEPGKQSRVELKNGRILDVVNGRYFAAGTSVVLQDGKIEAMPDLPGESQAPIDFTIDLQGKTVVPSLYNTHVHLLMAGTISMTAGLSDMRRSKKFQQQQIAKDLTECLAHGITHVRDAWRPDLRETQALKDRISKGEIPGPRILQAVAVGLPGSYLQEKASLMSKLTPMPNVDPTKDYAGAVAFPVNANEQQVRDAVDRAIDERGAEVIKIGEQLTSFNTGKPIPIMTIEQLSAVADQARRRGVQSTMHHMTVESFRRGVKAGVSSLAHGPMDALLTREDVKAFKASGCLNEPTISAFYALFSWRLAKALSNGHPELNRLTSFRDKTYTFSAIADEYYLPELRTNVMNSYKRSVSGKTKMMGIINMSGMLAWDPKVATAFENFGLLYEQGVLITTGNDTQTPCTSAMVDLELRMMDHILKGKPEGKQLSGAEAVRIATMNSARSLGLDQEFGSIESGKTADLVILDGDPLQDFRLIGSRVQALFMDGELLINNCGLQVEANGKAQ